MVVIARKGCDAAVVVLNRATRKTLRVESSLAGTALVRHVIGLSLYAAGAVAFFSGLLAPALATWVGGGLFALGLGAIVFAPPRDDVAAARAFDAFVDAQWKAAGDSGFAKGSAFR